MAGVVSDAGDDSWSGGEGTCVVVRAKHQAKDKKEGDKEEEAWHVRALWWGTDMSSCRQRRRRHVVRNVPIQGHTRCSPYTTHVIIASGGQPTEQSQLSPNQTMHVASLRPLDLNTMRIYQKCQYQVLEESECLLSGGGQCTSNPNVMDLSIHSN